jgi:hypothetical protein
MQQRAISLIFVASNSFGHQLSCHTIEVLTQMLSCARLMSGACEGVYWQNSTSHHMQTRVPANIAFGSHCAQGSHLYHNCKHLKSAAIWGCAVTCLIVESCMP